MTFGTMKTRVREIIEDPNATQVLDAELINKLNMAKDAVFGIVREGTSLYPQSTFSLTFPIGTKSINLGTYYILDFLKLYRLGNTGEVIRSYNLQGMQREEFLIDTEFRIYRNPAGAWVLERNFIGDPLTIQLECVVDVPDLTDADDDAEFTFGPNPTNNLIVAEAAVLLFSSRKRIEQAKIWQQISGKLEFNLRQLMTMHNKARPRMTIWAG